MTVDKRLLELPVARAAYSDRTAWLMAELSRLAYERFERPGDVLANVSKILAAATWPAPREQAPIS